MFTLICKINNKEIDMISVVNTGHVKNKKHLYRIIYPKELNHIEIYHKRKDPWQNLAYNILKEVLKNEN